MFALYFFVCVVVFCLRCVFLFALWFFVYVPNFFCLRCVFLFVLWPFWATKGPQVFGYFMSSSFVCALISQRKQ